MPSEPRGRRKPRPLRLGALVEAVESMLAGRTEQATEDLPEEAPDPGGRVGVGAAS